MLRILVVATLMLALQATAVHAEPSPKCGTSPVTVLKGTLVAPKPTGGCRLGLKEASGRVVLLLDSPLLATFKAGAQVEVSGALTDIQGAPALRVESARAADSRAARKYPWRGRCIHCGCHMQIDTAAEAETVCSECDCKKKGAECMP